MPKGRPVITWGPAAEMRRSRYRWAASQGLNAKACNACCTVRGMLAAFPDRDIPPEFLQRKREQSRYQIGPKIPECEARARRYAELKAAGADRFQASEGMLTDTAFAAVMRELRRG